MSNSEMDNPGPEAVDVTIFNQTYRLRSKTDKERVRHLANLVDERMRQISAQITTHDVVKIAVLTALNIADEMQSLRNYYEQEIQPLVSEFSGHQEESLKATETKKEAETRDEAAANKSWFDDFFESKVETKDRAERLSSQVSAKLQSLREPGADPTMGITTEDEGSG